LAIEVSAVVFHQSKIANQKSKLLPALASGSRFVRN